MPARRRLGEQRVPWGERHAERDAGHLAQELAPGTAMGAVSFDNLLCTFVQTHSAHLTLRGFSPHHLTLCRVLRSPLAANKPLSAAGKSIPFRVCIE